MSEKKGWTGGEIFILIFFIFLFILLIVGIIYYYQHTLRVVTSSVIPVSGHNYIIRHKTTGRNINVDLNTDEVVTTEHTFTTWLYVESGGVVKFNPSGIFDKFIIRDNSDVMYGEEECGNNEWLIDGNPSDGYSISPETNNNLCIEPNSDNVCKLQSCDDSDNQKFIFILVL